MHLSLGGRALALLIASCQLFFFSVHAVFFRPAYPALSRAAVAREQTVPGPTEIYHATWAPYHWESGGQKGNTGGPNSVDGGEKR